MGCKGPRHQSVATRVTVSFAAAPSALKKGLVQFLTFPALSYIVAVKF